jgi:putative CocE/NonD family hydrolase
MRTLNRPATPFLVEHDAAIPMRDATILRADIYRPDEPATTVATLLVRSPYGEGSFRGVGVVPALEKGFAVVLQHCRGRGSSDGEFRPWLDEGDDGFDTIGWITAQPWSNGDVVMSGLSYLAGCALQAAAKRPPGLRAVVANMTPYDFYDGLNYNGGAFALGSALHWGTLQGMLDLMHGTAAGADVGADADGRSASSRAAFAAILPLLGDPAAVQRTLPLSDLAAAVPFFGEWIAHPTRDEYWEGLAETLRHDDIEVPVMHMAGWFDIFLGGTLENRRRLGGPLTVGPWSHGPATASVGRLDFGFFASGQAAQLEQRELAFLASAGTDSGAASAGSSDSAVRIFVMGDNVWRDEPAWPLERAVPTRYHLHGDGRLATDEPADDAPRTFTHDPADPVPTLGGPLLLPNATLVGPQDQRDIEARPDVLCYTTEVLATDVEVTGPLSVTVRASTTGLSTDWTAKLIDVWPDGRAMSVIDGIARVAAEPGVPAEHVIDLVATSQVFKAGHCIRVQIASSNFPRFDRNPGTGKTAAETADLQVQHQSIYPRSFITLPIVPR